MKDTKRKQKVFEDNTSVPQYYFGGGTIKKIDYKLLVIGLLNIHKEKEMDSDLVKELLCLFILIVAFGLILYIIGIK